MVEVAMATIHLWITNKNNIVSRKKCVGNLLKFFFVIYKEIYFISRIYSMIYCLDLIVRNQTHCPTKIFEQKKIFRIFGTPYICTREKHTWAFNRGGRSGLCLFLEGIASVGSWKAIRGPVNPLLPRFYGGDVVNALRRRPAIGNPLNGGRVYLHGLENQAFAFPFSKIR